MLVRIRIRKLPVRVLALLIVRVLRSGLQRTNIYQVEDNVALTVRILRQIIFEILQNVIKLI